METPTPWITTKALSAEKVYNTHIPANDSISCIWPWAKSAKSLHVISFITKYIIKFLTAPGFELKFWMTYFLFTKLNTDQSATNRISINMLQFTDSVPKYWLIDYWI